MTLEVGAAKVDVSPAPNPDGTLDVPILGFWWERAKAYREIHDPLCARAVAFRSGGDTVVLVAVDMIGDAVGFSAAARSRAARQLDLQAEQIMVACTHAHTTPETIGLTDQGVADAWRDQLVDQIAHAAVQAVGALRPGVLHTAAGHLDGVSTNRRQALADRTDAAVLERLSPEQRRRSVALDTTLGVAWAHSADGEPIAAIVNFACHPVAVQTQPLISADYPGYAMARLERDVGCAPVCLFLNGATGDVNPIERSGFDHVATTGDRLTEAVRNLVDERRDTEGKDVADRPVTLGWASRTVRVARRAVPPRDELERRKREADAKVAQAGPVDLDDPYHHPGFDRYLVNELLALDAMPAELDAELQVLRIGELLWVGVPGELFTCLGQDIRRAGAPRPTWVVGYANGYLGYIAPEEAHVLGGYETSAGRWSPLARGGGETIRDTAIELIGRVI